MQCHKDLDFSTLRCQDAAGSGHHWWSSAEQRAEQKEQARAMDEATWDINGVSPAMDDESVDLGIALFSDKPAVWCGVS